MTNAECTEQEPRKNGRGLEPVSVELLSGSAGLRVEGEGERGLRPGDHVLIAAHRGVHGKGRAALPLTSVPISKQSQTWRPFRRSVDIHLAR